MLRIRLKYKRILAFVLAILMLFNVFPTYSTYADETENEVTVWYFNSASECMEEANTVELYRGGEQILSAFLRDDILGDVQWQIETKQDVWVDIQGGITEDLRVSYSMVKSLLNDNAVRMRCVVLGDEEYYSSPFTIVVTNEETSLSSDTFNIKRDSVAPDPLPAPIGISNDSESKEEKREIVVNEETESVTKEETEAEVEEEETEAEAEEEETEAEAEEEETEAEAEEEETEAEVEEEETEAEVEEEAEAETKEEVIVKISNPKAKVMLLNSTNNIATETTPPIKDEDSTYYTVTIEYIYTDEQNSDGEYLSKFYGQRVALPYIAEVASGDTLSEVVNSPNCVGYTPDIKSIDLSEWGNITNDLGLTVEYSPAEVSYTVRHYQQNVDNDDYTWVDTTMATGYTEALTSDNAANEYIGFTALSHYHEEIAADSSTMIDVYYDRNYYLISFDLGGGYGVDPIYSRYGSDLSVGTPTRTGWTFVDWDLMEIDSDSDGKPDQGDKIADDIPATVPDGNCTYIAMWNPLSGTKYSVVYWAENGDGTNTYLTSSEHVAESGDVVSGVDDICGTEAHIHTDACYNCGKLEHTHHKKHDVSCYSYIELGRTVSNSSNDKYVINKTNELHQDTSDTYLYVIYTSWDSSLWPKILLNGQYYTVYIDGSQTISRERLSQIVDGEYLARGEYNTSPKYYAEKYKLKADCEITLCEADCSIKEHSHEAACILCGKSEHTHDSNCRPVIVENLDFVSAQQNVIVEGDGSTVVNVYYTYRTYKIRYVYARKNTANTYQIATKTNQGGFGDCEWTSIGTDAAVLPTFSDPSGETERSEFFRTEDGCTYYYISLTAKYGEDITKKWPAANIGSVTSGITTYTWGSWASAPGTPYRQNSFLNANIVGIYPVMSSDMIVKNPELLEIRDDGTKVYLAQNMIAWWAQGGVGNHVYHNFFEVFSLPAKKTEGDAIVEGVLSISNGAGSDVTYKTYKYQSSEGDIYATYIENILDSDPNYGKIYELSNVEFTAAHNDTTRVDPVVYAGYTVINSNPTKQSGSSNYKENKECPSDVIDGYCNVFIYNRQMNKLTFKNYGKDLDGFKDLPVAYGTLLQQYEQGDTGASAVARANYPEGLEKDVYEFAGWYTTSECRTGTEVDWSKQTMPDSDLVLYAKWSLITYDVSVYLTDVLSNPIGQTQTVIHNGFAIEPDKTTLVHPTDSSAEFIGWFYNDKQSATDTDYNEYAFSFASTPITQDMKVYAKWRSNQMKQVEIYYVVEDADGNQTQIADTETLMLRLGQTRTFDAKTGSSVYAEYRAGCFPTTASHSITITDSNFTSANPVTYTFVYKQYGAVPYQVEFYVKEKDGTERPAFKVTNGDAEFVDSATYLSWTDDKKAEFAASNTSVSNGIDLTEGGQYIEQHWQNDKAIVVELYIPDNLEDPLWTLPDEYLPSALKIQKVIVPSNKEGVNSEDDIEANTIKFIYSYMDPGTDPGNPIYEARYLVQHFIQNVDYLLADEAEKINLEEYILYDYSDDSGLSGEMVVANPISIPGYTYGYNVTNHYMGIYNTSYRQNVDKNVLTETPATMTGLITADDKLELNFYYEINSYPYQVMYLEEGSNRELAPVKNTTSGGDKLTGLYGSKITEEAINIEGYEVVGDTRKTIYIHMEVSETASVNTIVFYYKYKSADLEITKTVELDPTQAAQEGIAEIPSWVENQEFVFTIYREAGYPKSFYYYKYTDKNGNIQDNQRVNADTQTIEVRLKPGEKIQIHDLPMGSYTVTETYVPGFRTSVDEYIAQAHNITLATNDQTETLNFLNTFPFYTGDVVIKKKVTKLDESDPTAVRSYKVNVVLEPDDSVPEIREVDRVITFVDGNGNSVTDKDGNSSFTIPKLSDSYQVKKFSFDILVPVDGEVKMEGVPVGSFTVTEEVQGTVGYIFDYYTVKYNKAVHENDEVTGTNHAVTGVIHGGHPTAVTFTNTYKKGDLTINKTVTQEYSNDNWTSDTFTFEINGTTELPDGTYVVDGASVNVSGGKVTVKDSSGNNPSITISKAGDGTSWSGSLAFENLPAGYYTVTETAGLGNNRYRAEKPDSSLLVNNTATATQANFTNTYKRTTGNLKISKEIEIVGEGYRIDSDKVFTFIVSLQDGVLADSYSCQVTTSGGQTVDNGHTSLDVEDGKLTFALKHNQNILIENLPVGQYEIFEKQEKGYASHYNGAEAATEKVTVKVETEETTVLNCVNKYPVNYGTLTISKTVTTQAGNSGIDTFPKNDVFEFTVQVADYDELFDLDKFVEASFSSNAGNPKFEINNNTLVFTLMHDQSVELILPPCTYTIAETGLSSTVNPDNELAKHYTTAVTVGGNEGVSGGSYTLVSGGNEQVVFTNTYKRHYADLTIDTNGNDPEQSYIYTVNQILEDNSIGISLQVVLNGNTQKTIKGLPVGVYNIHEESKWSWRQKALADKRVELNESKTVYFDFGLREFIYWLSGYSYGKYWKGGNS